MCYSLAGPPRCSGTIRGSRRAFLTEKVRKIGENRVGSTRDEASVRLFVRPTRLLMRPTRLFMRPIWRNYWATIHGTTRLSNETYETIRETREEYSGNKRLPLYDFRFFPDFLGDDTWSLVKVVLVHVDQ